MPGPVIIEQNLASGASCESDGRCQRPAFVILDQAIIGKSRAEGDLLDSVRQTLDRRSPPNCPLFLGLRRQWSSILMLRNLKSPETYFQAAFRVQSPWSIKNPNGDDPNEEEILKPVCLGFDFAPTRALRQLSDYAIGLSPNEPNPENAVKDLVSFLPVLAYDGANMTQIDAGGILDIAMAGTSATLLARKWESALLVNVDNDALRRILDDPEAMAAVERIEGWRSLGDNIIEMIINKSEKIKELKNKAKDKELTERQKKQLTEEEKEYKSKRKLVQEKLIKFATRIPAFIYFTDFRENTLQDVITKIEPDS